MKSMDNLIRNYIDPYKTQFLMLGALIILFTLLKSFSENLVAIFLLGLLSFAILTIFFSILSGFFFNFKRRLNLLDVTYEVFFLLFFLGFFFLIWTEFGEPFMVSLGIFASYVSVAIFKEMRHWLVIFHREVGKGKGLPFFILNSGIILLYIVLIRYLHRFVVEMISYSFQNSALTIGIGELSLGYFFALPFYLFTWTSFAVFIILFLRDLFKEEILHSDIQTKETYLGRLYGKLRNLLEK